MEMDCEAQAWAMEDQQALVVAKRCSLSSEPRPW